MCVCTVSSIYNMIYSSEYNAPARGLENVRAEQNRDYGSFFRRFGLLFCALFCAFYYFRLVFASLFYVRHMQSGFSAVTTEAWLFTPSTPPYSPERWRVHRFNGYNVQLLLCAMPAFAMRQRDLAMAWCWRWSARHHAPIVTLWPMPMLARTEEHRKYVKNVSTGERAVAAAASFLCSPNG